MNAMQVAERMTAQEFLEAPERERGWPLNLVDGEVVMNDPTVLHGNAQKQVLLALEHWIRGGERRGAVFFPLDVMLDERNVFKPDVAWYAEGRAPALRAPRPYPMPDLAVEVRSPSTWRYDVGVKKSSYERHGLPELWLVDTAAEAVLAFRRSDSAASTFDVALELSAGDRLASPLLPGFGVEVAELFRSGA